MSKTTDLPIHEVILKIMYHADKEKSAELSAQDILWKIDNPEITERYIREVLGWLIREKKVQLYLNKYSLDRYEFLEQKSKYDDDEEEDIIVKGVDTFYIKPSKKKTKNRRSIVLFSISLLALCYITYLFANMDRNYQVSTKIITLNSVVNKQKNAHKLYLSDEEENIKKKIEDISYLFSRQNNNNANMQKEIARLYKITDSLQQQQQARLNLIQKGIDKERNENIGYINDILQKIIYGNIIFLLLFTVIFFKGKI